MQYTHVCYDVLECLLKVKSNVEGLDGISPKFIKLWLPLLLSHITQILNTAITTCTFSSAWKYARTVPIPKSQTDLRPKPRLPFLSKIFLKIYRRHRYNPLWITFPCIVRSTLGLIKNRIWISAITDVVEDIWSRLDKNWITFLTVLDHSKAFDTVNRSILCTKLKNLFNFSDSAIMPLRSYLTGRQQAVIYRVVYFLLCFGD